MMNADRIISILRDANNSGQIRTTTTSFPRFNPPQAEVTAEIAEAIKSELLRSSLIAETFADGTLLFIGYSEAHLSIDFLVKWLLFRTQKVGPAEALADLNRFLSSDTLEGTEKLIVIGLPVRGYVIIGNGITLTMVNHHEEIDSPQLARIYQSLFSDSINEPDHILPLAALECRIPHKKILLRREETFRYPTALYESRRDDLDTARRFLAIVSDYARPVPMGSWWQPDPWIPCMIPYGAISRPYETDRPWSGTSIQEAQLESAVRLYESFYRFSQLDQKRLLMVLDRLNSARRAVSSADKALDLGMAAEYLFLYEPGKGKLSLSEKKGIKCRLCGRAAWLLESSGDKATVAKLFGDLYKCRSEIVHAGEFSPSMQDKQEKVLSESGELMTKAVREIITRETFPTWDVVT
jgi:hypothetical protein